ncbi:MAG: CheR family methyltransferase [Puia sp.]
MVPSGLKAIKAQGGITFAQEQNSASYDAMPQSAIDADVVDFILTPESIPKQLMILNERFKQNPGQNQHNSDQKQEEDFKKILSLLRIRRGVDFTYYKQPTIRRRISRRIALSLHGNVSDYLIFLKENKPEMDILYQDLLIPVTEFFRDPGIFESVREKLLPELFKNKANYEPVRVWIAGCSTGEEAYSILMSLHEYLGDKASIFKIQVFATDISEAAIAKARTGIYKTTEVDGLSVERLQKFFTKTNGGFQINKVIRDTCIFALHNYLKDPPFANIDLVSCRNSLIYMDPYLQKNALNTFHYSLNDHGFLLLGKSETAGQVSGLFNTFDKNNKIYTRNPVRGRYSKVIADRKQEFFKNSNYKVGNIDGPKDDFQKNADDVLLSRYVPPRRNREQRNGHRTISWIYRNVAGTYNGEAKFKCF